MNNTVVAVKIVRSGECAMRWGGGDVQSLAVGQQIFIGRLRGDDADAINFCYNVKNGKH